MDNTQRNGLMRRTAGRMWGNPVQSQKKLADGVTFYSTPGHGGVVVDPVRFKLAAPLLLSTPGGDYHPQSVGFWQAGNEVARMFAFEEDVDMMVLLYWHPELLPAYQRVFQGSVTLTDAESTVRHYYAGLLKEEVLSVS